VPDYLVTCTIPNAAPLGTPGGSAEVHQRERIVRAKNEAAALKHVVSDTITITRATIDDAMRLAGVGAKVEQAAE
jgi:predicted GNAT family acetyltransferase